LNLPLETIDKELKKFRDIGLRRGMFQERDSRRVENGVRVGAEPRLFNAEKIIKKIEEIRELKLVIEDFTRFAGNKTFDKIDSSVEDLGLAVMSELSSYISQTSTSIDTSTQQIMTLTGSITTNDLKTIFEIDNDKLIVKLNSLNLALASIVKRINVLHKEKGESLEKVYNTIDITTKWYTSAVSRVARVVHSPAMALLRSGTGPQRAVSAGGGYVNVDTNIEKSKSFYNIIKKLTILNDLINTYKIKLTNIIDSYGVTIQMIKRCILYTFYILTISKEIADSRYIIRKSMLTSIELNNMIGNIEKKKGADPDYSLIYARAINFLKYLRSKMGDDSVLILDPYKKSIYDIVLCFHIDEVLAR
jgi:hypothetical protein